MSAFLGDDGQEPLEAVDVSFVEVRYNCEAEVVHVREHDPPRDCYVEWGHVVEEEEGGDWGALGGTH